MSFPSGADYMEALQHPGDCFANDPELANGVPAMSPLGLPRAVSGNFASVFRVDCDSGHTYAVRCFTRWFDDQYQRYDALSRRLRRIAPRWAVAFDFVREGVNVGGEWYPMVKMPWVPAEPLLTYVERHLWDTATISYLTVRFAALVADLQRAGIAHGDLQHGNVLVAPGGDLRLIDYDGMFIPELAGLPSNELGHRNYQHPRRRRDEFGPHLDRFAALVMYASLCATSIDPLLWGRLDGGDECMLFRSRDFADPDTSEAVRALESSADDRLRALAKVVREALAVPLMDVVPLSAGGVPPPATGLANEMTAAELAAVAERKSLFAALRGSAEPVVAQPTDDFVVDGRGREPARPVVPKEFGPAIVRHRRLLVVAVGAIIAFLVLGALALVPLILAMALAAAAGASSTALARHQFHSMPEIRAIRPKQLELAELERNAAAAQAVVDEIARGRGETDRLEGVAGRDREGADRDAHEDAQAKIAAVEVELRDALITISARESDLYRQEHHDRAEALRALQRAALDVELEAVRLASARLTAIGDQLVYALALDDVRTAADFVDVVEVAPKARGKPVEVALVRRDGQHIRSSGLGSEEAATLMKWRRLLETKFSPSVPQTLPAELEQKRHGEFEARRAELAAEETRLRTEAAARVTDIRSRARPRHEEAAGRQTAAQQDAATRRLKLDHELTKANKALAEAEWRRGACARELDSYAGLTFAAFLRRVAGLR